MNWIQWPKEGDWPNSRDQEAPLCENADLKWSAGPRKFEIDCDAMAEHDLRVDPISKAVLLKCGLTMGVAAAPIVPVSTAKA